MLPSFPLLVGREVYTVARPHANLRCALFFEYSVKESLLHRAGEPKLVFNWPKEGSKREPQNVFLDWLRHGVGKKIL